MTTNDFQEYLRENAQGEFVKQQGSRKDIKNAFTKKHLAAKRIARHSCRARIETI